MVKENIYDYYRDMQDIMSRDTENYNTFLSYFYDTISIIDDAQKGSVSWKDTIQAIEDYTGQLDIALGEQRWKRACCDPEAKRDRDVYAQFREDFPQSLTDSIEALLEDKVKVGIAVHECMDTFRDTISSAYLDEDTDTLHFFISSETKGRQEVVIPLIGRDRMDVMKYFYCMIIDHLINPYNNHVDIEDGKIIYHIPVDYFSGCHYSRFSSNQKEKYNLIVSQLKETYQGACSFDDVVNRNSYRSIKGLCFSVSLI